MFAGRRGYDGPGGLRENLNQGGRVCGDIKNLCKLVLTCAKVARDRERITLTTSPHHAEIAIDGLSPGP